ncbi:NAD(P)-dependent oxidoreductase [Orrella sp. NBD-18]|uniref:NAD(P)-dependent oxidoreductase n=1 Tax=Sheuella amnicola TaxID=2707330 RepID=A0A6B2R3N1_9BURK|nr:NAD(P)-dependent oxidoreductase [Sheuella amnicola]NDY84324.1 NAD(P)-dependent oxidoreductase [Sheuella amnicola]
MQNVSGTAKTSVGLIGLGAMGRGIAQNLLAKGFAVVGRDVNPDALKWLESVGGSSGQQAREMADMCQVIVSFVVNDKQTEEVLFGENGLAAVMRPDSVFIACSTLPPQYVKELGARLAEKKIHLIDSPVTGGKVGAEKGTLTVMVAGEEAIFERVKPVLSTFGARLFFLGTEHGKGSQMKVINQLLCGVHIAAAAEALAMARENGLPMETTLEILKSGAASSWMLGDRGPRMVTEKYDDVLSAVDIFVKDLGLVLDAARQSTFAAPMAHAAFLQFIEASGHGMGRLDDAAVINNYKK